MTAPAWQPCHFCAAELLPDIEGMVHPDSDTCPLDSIYVSNDDREAWNTRFTSNALDAARVSVLDEIEEYITQAMAMEEAGYGFSWPEMHKVLRALRTPARAAHTDDKGVDQFAAAMKAKLKYSREIKGRGGWDNKNGVTSGYLSRLLREHVEKGDPLDVGSLAMMIHQRGDQIADETAPESDLCSTSEPQRAGTVQEAAKVLLDALDAHNFDVVVGACFGDEAASRVMQDSRPLVFARAMLTATINYLDPSLDHLRAGAIAGGGDD